MKKFSFLVSTYSDEDSQLVEQKRKADTLFKEGETKQAQDIYHQIRLPGYSYLRAMFGDTTLELVSTVGMYQATLEPSIQATITFQDQQQLDAQLVTLKRHLVNFGRHFKQKTVHGVQPYAQRPDGVEYGTPLGDLADIAFQKKTRIALQKITPNPFDNFLRLYEFATKAGLKHLTCDVVGGQILIYSVGKNDPQFDDATQRFSSILKEEGLIFQLNPAGGDVELINYGHGGCGETHTYDQVERRLAPTE